LFRDREIGINHNGDVDLAKRLIDIAADAGCDAVKFQKRTVEVVYTAESWPVRARTRSDDQRGLEAPGWSLPGRVPAVGRPLSREGVLWTARVGRGSVDFIDSFEVSFHKVASACLTDDAC